MGILGDGRRVWERACGNELVDRRMWKGKKSVTLQTFEPLCKVE